MRNLISGGDSIDFHIFVNGQEKFSITADGPKMPESPFDFDTTIAAGETVDFVLGNNGSGNPLADESLLRAVILH